VLAGIFDVAAAADFCAPPAPFSRWQARWLLLGAALLMVVGIAVTFSPARSGYATNRRNDNWRTPLPMWLIAKLPETVGKLILCALALVLIACGVRLMARSLTLSPPRLRIGFVPGRSVGQGILCGILSSGP
jgi:hypothetical protein